MATMAVTASNPRARAKRTRQAPLAGAFSVFAAFAAPAHALEWRIEPGVGTQVSFSDNVNQRDDKQSGSAFSVTPDVTVRSAGSRRVQASLRYGLSAVVRAGGGRDDDLIHNLGATGKAELVEDFLFVDGSANVSQQLVSLLGSPTDATTNDNNRADVGTYSISPYAVRRLGSYATAQVRYALSGAIFENDVAASSNANTFTANLDSGPRFNDLDWGLAYSYRKAENRNSPVATANRDVTFESYNLRLGYALSRKFQVFGTLGQDNNQFLSTTDNDGRSYTLGFRWAPSRRTNLEISAGDRYFGTTYRLAASHRTRLTNWTVRYSEDVSDITEQLLGQSSRQFWNCGGAILESFDGNPPAGFSNCVGPVSGGQLTFNPTGFGLTEANLAALGLSTVSTTNGVFILKTLNAGVSWQLGRFDFGFSVQDTRRLFQNQGDAEDRVQGGNASIAYRMSPHTTVNGGVSYTRNTLDSTLTSGVARDDDIVTLNAGIDHRFGSRLNGALTFRHTQRDSNEATADFDENSLIASARLRF